MKFATLCYLRSGDKTLMVHRIKKQNDMHEGKWNGLGGKLEPGETPEECAIREIREESGLTVNTVLLKGFITFPNFDGVHSWYCFIFTAVGFEGEFIDSPEGRLEWIDNDKLKELNLWEGDRIFFDWLDQERFFSAKFIYKDGKLISHEVKFY
jgi:8-oxo-dGTP diphosphatase